MYDWLQTELHKDAAKNYQLYKIVRNILFVSLYNLNCHVAYVAHNIYLN